MFRNLLQSHFHLNLSLIFEDWKSAVHCKKTHENQACHRWNGCNGIMSETKTKHTVYRRYILVSVISSVFMRRFRYFWNVVQCTFTHTVAIENYMSTVFNTSYAAYLFLTISTLKSWVFLTPFTVYFYQCKTLIFCISCTEKKLIITLLKVLTREDF